MHIAYPFVTRNGIGLAAQGNFNNRPAIRIHSRRGSAHCISVPVLLQRTVSYRGYPRADHVFADYRPGLSVNGMSGRK